MSTNDNDLVDAPRRMVCPFCKRLVKVHDPYRGVLPKRASAWFVQHKDANGRRCDGSTMGAFDRTPRPASEEGEVPIE